MNSKHRTLEELTKSVQNFHKRVALDVRWKLCSECRLMDCKPKSPNCSVRRLINDRQRKRYWLDPEKHRDRVRAHNLTPEQKEKETARKRAYEKESPVHAKMTRRAWYERNRPTILAKARARHHAKKEAARATVL
jgi:hypothetical protein